MEYINLVLGIGLLIVFIWLSKRNSRRIGFIFSLAYIDIIIGITCGIYLIFTSIHALLF